MYQDRVMPRWLILVARSDLPSDLHLICSQLPSLTPSQADLAKPQVRAMITPLPVTCRQLTPWGVTFAGAKPDRPVTHSGQNFETKVTLRNRPHYSESIPRPTCSFRTEQLP